MLKRFIWSAGWRVALIAMFAALLVGCDDQLQATVEDGVISASSSLFGTLLEAIIAVVSEQATAMILF